MIKNDIVLIFLLTLPVIVAIGIPLLIQYLQVKNLPEQVEKVKVVKKRKELHETESGLSIYHHFITFKFPDGSEKEFFVPPDSDERDLFPSNLYYSVQKNDRGTLTYKERKNAIKRMKNEKRHYNEREFISFKKDAF